MKMASIYINKQDIAEKLGIEEDKFIFGKVENSYHDIDIQIIIDDSAEVENSANVTSNHWNLKRQNLFNIQY